MAFTFAIIGCGLTGTSALCQFVRTLKERIGPSPCGSPGIRIVVIEKQDSFGPGFPHNDQFVMPCHMSNTCAEDMGILSEVPRDFQDWVEAESARLAPRFNAFFENRVPWGERCTSYPRVVLGEYLKARFAESVQAAQGLGCEMVLYPRCEALDAAEKGEKVTLLIKELVGGKTFSLEADRVLLATGHWFKKSNNAGWFASPWPARALLEGIPNGASVAVLGSSLSAVDAVLTLTAEDEFYRDPSGELKYRRPSPPRKIALFSRKGILPKVRGKLGDYKNRFLTQGNVEHLLKGCGEEPALEGLFRLLRLDLEAVYGHPMPWAEVMNPSLSPIETLERDLKRAKEGDGPQGELLWQTVLHQSFSMAREIYQHLSAGDKERFERQHSTLFFSYAAPMPPLVAEKLLAIMKSGTVEVVKLAKSYSLQRDASGRGYMLLYGEPHVGMRKDHYAYVVDARGQERSFANDPSELTKNLLRSGTVQVERLTLRRLDEPVGPRDTAGGENLHDSGSLWIDPESHQVQKMKADGSILRSRCLYAVGIMTRGQILDASTARGCALSAARVASQWANLVD
jgi:uncharacterized NAD(P)/FAD-binding protein YdhS